MYKAINSLGHNLWPHLWSASLMSPLQVAGHQGRLLLCSQSLHQTWADLSSDAPAEPSRTSEAVLRTLRTFKSTLKTTSYWLIRLHPAYIIQASADIYFQSSTFIVHFCFKWLPCNIFLQRWFAGKIQAMRWFDCFQSPAPASSSSSVWERCMRRVPGHRQVVHLTCPS